MDQEKDKQGFSLPSGYGEDFARRMSERLACLEELKAHSRLISLKGSHGFNVPAAYFEEKMDVLALAVLPPPDDAFGVPAGYFESGADLLKRSAGDQTLGKFGNRSPIKKVINLRRPVYWMAAAIVIITLGVWLYGAHQQTPAQEDCGTLACLEKSDVLGSGELDALSEEDLLLLVTDEDLRQEVWEGAPGTDSAGKRGSGKPIKNDI